MIPGYSPPNLTLTDHIHLGMWSDSPVGFGPQGEPPYKFNTVRDRMPHTEFMIDFKRSWDGTPFPDVLKDEDGNPIVFNDYEYTLRLDNNQYDLLIHLVGRKVFLIDNWHCADDQSHTGFIKIMQFVDLEYDSYDDQLLTYSAVKAIFKDMYTVSPV